MGGSHPWSGPALPLVLATAAIFGACSGSSVQLTSTGSGGASSGSHHAASGSGGDLFMAGSGGASSQTLEVTPTAEQTITVPAGQQMPAVTFDATLGGQPVSAGWSLDRGEIGTIPQAASPMGVFTPSGSVGGLVNVTASVVVSGKTQTQKRQVFVQLTASQNGPNGSAAEKGQLASDPATLTQGGGIGGVGGEGLGGAVADPATSAALDKPADDGSALGLRLIYPYDKTVWPRGILAPLLMWQWQAGDADAIAIKLSTKSGSFSYTGKFGRPAILAQTGGKFIRHPVPQDAWQMATDSAGSLLPDNTVDALTLELTVAKGGVAHGPIKQTWPVTAARLSGIIYYNSYGTQLAKNLGGAIGGDGQFGGAVLKIHVGDTGPTLANPQDTACKVCHSVAANGSRLVAMDYGTGWAFDLKPNGATETQLASYTNKFPGMYPDGSKVLTGDGRLLPLPDDGNPLPANGLPGGNLGTPAFAPDGKLAAVSQGAQLVVLDFANATNTFSNPKVVADDNGQPFGVRSGWPAFLPDDKAVVFEHQSQDGGDGFDGTLWTRKGAKGLIAWTAVAAKDVAPLNLLNGQGYLPKLAQPINMACYGDGQSVGQIDPDHGDDIDLNYEPTVAPTAPGGYAWVVFTSRRMYGSVATIPPFCSDPRGVDLVQNITPKKLWVAAVSLGAKPGTDPSHPAFYLPGQELLAGNSRGFWVLDACKKDGAPCKSGDECCGGFCEPNGDKGALICDNKSNTGCAMAGDKCKTAADCCDPGFLCIDGFCAPPPPPQ